ncbi:unnamed protein product [Chrysoparadoxa australica]
MLFPRKGLYFEVPVMRIARASPKKVEAGVRSTFRTLGESATTRMREKRRLTRLSEPIPASLLETRSKITYERPAVRSTFRSVATRAAANAHLTSMGIYPVIGLAAAVAATGCLYSLGIGADNGATAASPVMRSVKASECSSRNRNRSAMRAMQNQRAPAAATSAQATTITASSTRSETQQPLWLQRPREAV